MLPVIPARLSELGFDGFFEVSFAALPDAGLEPARVLSDHGADVIVASATQTAPALLAPGLGAGAERPVVGDWVALRRDVAASALIEAVLPRRTAVLRRATADSGAVRQVLAANVDVVFAVMALDRDFNLRRLERLLAVAWSSGARPAVLLTKADLHSDPDGAAEQVASVAGDAPILTSSAITEAGLDDLRRLVAPGRTAVLLGSSGIGKSSLVNTLIGSERLKVAAVRERDRRGRHTSTARELIEIPQGGMVIDTPGLREIQLWLDESSVARLFDDLDELVSRCRFSNCGHISEPGCAVRAALLDGSLPSERWQSYLKLRRELEGTRADIRDRGRRVGMLRKRRFVNAARERESRNG